MAERTRLRSDRLLEALSLSLSPARLFPSVSNCLYLSAWLLVHPFLWWSIAFSVYLRLYLSLSAYLSFHQTMYLVVLLSIYLPAHHSTITSIDPAIRLLIYLFNLPSICLYFYVSIEVSFYPSLDPCVSHSFYVRTIGQEHRQGGGSRSRKREPTTTYRNIVNDFCPKNHLQFSKTCLKHVLLTCGKEQNPLSLPGQTAS